MPLIRDIVFLCTVVVGAYVLFSVTYCLWLLLVALIATVSRNRRVPEPVLPSTIFCILIPAHNEEAVISETLQSIGALKFPKECYQTYVIADNCTDRTADVASSFTFVKALTRINPDERGKGYALNWALNMIPQEFEWDSVIVVDADTRVDPNFLSAMDAERAKYPPGTFVAQGRYDVLNAGESWRTSLLAGALSLVHVLRPTARQALGFTVGLKGNGMCFDREALQKVPWRGDALTEDIEQALDLLGKDITVKFAGKAVVAALMPATAKGASSQRERWENGRSQIVKRRAFKLLYEGLTKFRPSYIDASIDLLIPPLAEMAAALFVWCSLIVVFKLIGGSAHLLPFLAVYAVVGFLTYIVAGFVVAGAPPKAFQALFYAPIYTLWKVVLRLRKPTGKTTEWVRTSREAAGPGGDSDLGES